MGKPKLEGAWAKINRAKYHLEQLRLELSRNPHGISFGDDLQARQHVFRYKVPQKVLIHYAVLSGEIIGHTRSALEHTVWEMVLRPNPHKTGFPVIMERVKYKDDGRTKIKRINKEAATIIKRLQPFNNGGENSTLWILHDMWNTDKHKLLHVVVTEVAAIARTYLSGGRFVQRFSGGFLGKLKDDTEVRIDFPDFYDPREMRMKPELLARLEFDTIPGQPFETLLTKLVNFGESTVQELADTLP